MIRTYRWGAHPSINVEGRWKVSRDPPRNNAECRDLFVHKSDAEQLLAWRNEWEDAKVKHNDLHTTEPTF